MKPLEHLIHQADEILKGRGALTEDWRDALDLYKAAGEMGSGVAYKKIGDMYADGKYLKIELEKSLINYKKSVNLDYMPALAEMAVVYAHMKDTDNCFRAWKNYFEYIDKTSFKDSQIAEKIQAYLILRSAFDDSIDLYECFFENFDVVFRLLQNTINGLIDSVKSKADYLGNYDKEHLYIPKEMIKKYRPLS